MKLWILTALSAAMLSLTSSFLFAESSNTRFSDQIETYIGKGENAGLYWPTKSWKACRPEAVGLDSKRLAIAMEYAVGYEFKTDGIIIIKDGYIVAESYLGDFKQNTQHNGYSIAKSITGALIGIAIDKGVIENIDEKVCQYYEDWNCADKNDKRSKMTIRHAITMTSGLKWEEKWSQQDIPDNDTLKMAKSGYFVRYLSKTPGRFDPGTQFAYSSGDTTLLTKVIQGASGMTAFKFAQKHLFEPLNIQDISWDNDKDGYTATAWGIHATLRDYAKFGLLYLKKGKWENQQVVSEKWIEASLQTDTSVNMWRALGYLWHVNLPARLYGTRTPDYDIPEDAYMAHGIRGQNILVLPSDNILIVRVADQRREKLDLAMLIHMVLDSKK